MRFSVNQAFEAKAEGDPIMIPGAAAERIIKQHTEETFQSFLDDTYQGNARDDYDAADVLGWLGY